MKGQLVDAGVVVLILCALFIGLSVAAAAIIVLHGDPNAQLVPKLIEWAGLVLTALFAALGMKHGSDTANGGAPGKGAPPAAEPPVAADSATSKTPADR